MTLNDQFGGFAMGISNLFIERIWTSDSFTCAVAPLRPCALAPLSHTFIFILLSFIFYYFLALSV